jgi:energy-coupling factor transporter ATP-binding protein EcfA2
MDQPAALSVKGLTFNYHTRSEPALENVNLELFPGQVLLLAGASGSGKTTLIRCINGLIRVPIMAISAVRSAFSASPCVK